MKDLVNFNKILPYSFELYLYCSRFEEDDLFNRMEEGRGDYGSNKRAGFKEIFKNDVRSEDDTQSGRTRVLMSVLMDLADIEEKTDKRGNGSSVAQEETDEAEQNKLNDELERAEKKLAEYETEINAKKKTKSGKDTEAEKQYNVMLYISKEEEETGKRSLPGVLKLFMKKINPEPKEIVQPPSYSEAVTYQYVKKSRTSKEEVKEKVVLRKKCDASTQVDNRHKFMKNQP